MEQLRAEEAAARARREGPKELGDIDTDDEKDGDADYEQWRQREMRRIRCALLLPSAQRGHLWSPSLLQVYLQGNAWLVFVGLSRLPLQYSHTCQTVPGVQRQTLVAQHKQADGTIDVYIFHLWLQCHGCNTMGHRDCHNGKPKAAITEWHAVLDTIHMARCAHFLAVDIGCFFGRRDREEREAQKEEEAEKERLRKMTPEQRAAWERENPKQVAVAPKKTWKFMQKYWHKGAYFQVRCHRIII